MSMAVAAARTRERATPASKRRTQTVALSSLLRRVPQGFWSDDSGATAVEYAALLMLIGVIVLTAVTVLGQNIAGFFDRLRAAITAMGF